jgi:hypothetical protein
MLLKNSHAVAHVIRLSLKVDDVKDIAKSGAEVHLSP